MSTLPNHTVSHRHLAVLNWPPEILPVTPMKWFPLSNELITNHLCINKKLIMYITITTQSSANLYVVSLVRTREKKRQKPAKRTPSLIKINQRLTPNTLHSRRFLSSELLFWFKKNCRNCAWFIKLSRNLNRFGGNDGRWFWHFFWMRIIHRTCCFLTFFVNWCVELCRLFIGFKCMYTEIYWMKSRQTKDICGKVFMNFSYI